MSNITSVVFDKCDETKVIYGGLWQYDYGQILRIEGLDLPPAVEIHFSLQETGGEAKRRIGITKSGVTDVVIPDFILEGNDATRNYDAYAFIYLSDEESGETTHKIKMQIKSRSKPEGSSKEEDTSFGAIMDAVNKIAEQNGQGVSDEKIAEAVNAYMEANPVEGNVTVDTDLSETSTNPVANSTVTKKFSQLSDTIANGNIGSAVEPATDDIPKVFINGTIPTTKDENNAEIYYDSKTLSFHAHIGIKCQGSSSMQYAKKNFTIKLYEDDAHETKLKKNFKGWGEQSKFVLKANYIDHSHARNIICARLWSDIVASRGDYNSLPVELRTSPNNGAVDGFPVKVYNNGVYQGLYTWNIPKDTWMNNMDDSLDTHCILVGESNGDDSCMFRTGTVSQWTDEIHDSMPASITASWGNVLTFVSSSTDEEFVANLENYLDVQSVIDFYIFAYAFCLLDSLGKNQIFFTYDGTKWYESAYDMDTTFGLWWTGAWFVSATTAFQSGYVNGTQYSTSNLLYERMETLFTERIKSRYAELRSGVLSLRHIIRRFEEFTDIISNDLYAEDGDIYGIPSMNTNNIQQIRQFAVDRLAYVDAKMETIGEVTYFSITNSLSNATTDNATESVEEGTSYVATITVNSRYTLDSVTVTMGGVDITSTVYNNGVITIEAVTAPVIITVNAIEIDDSVLVYDLSRFTTANGTLTTYADGEWSFAANKSYSNAINLSPLIPYANVKNKTITVSFTCKSDDWVSGAGNPSVIPSLHDGSEVSGSTRLKWKEVALTQSLTNEYTEYTLEFVAEDSYFTSGSGTITDEAYFNIQLLNYASASLNVCAVNIKAE